MCQVQWSGPMLPRLAAIPPCAATVWLRVGKTLVMQAVFRPLFGRAHRRAKAGAAGADDDDVIAMVDDLVGAHAAASEGDLAEREQGQRRAADGEEQQQGVEREAVAFVVDIIVDDDLHPVERRARRLAMTNSAIGTAPRRLAQPFGQRALVERRQASAARRSARRRAAAGRRSTRARDSQCSPPWRAEPRPRTLPSGVALSPTLIVPLPAA